MAKILIHIEPLQVRPNSFKTDTVSVLKDGRPISFIRDKEVDIEEGTIITIKHSIFYMGVPNIKSATLQAIDGSEVYRITTPSNSYIVGTFEVLSNSGLKVEKVSKTNEIPKAFRRRIL